MVTAGDLIAFGADHGLIVHPSRDPEKWAEDVNNNGGACLCDADRRCPCQEAITEVGAAHRPAQEQCCVCRFYVSAAYIAHYYPDGVPIADTPVSEETPVEHSLSHLVDPAVAAIADQVVENIEQALTKFDAEEYDTVFDDLATLSDALECEVCDEALMTEAIHVSNVRNVCDYSQTACVEERDRVRKRLVRLQQMYVEIRGTSEQTPNETPERRELPPYHTRMSECLTDEAKFTGLEKKLRFCGCSKISSDKATTEEEAIELCTIGTLGEDVDG